MPVLKPADHGVDLVSRAMRRPSARHRDRFTLSSPHGASLKPADHDIDLVSRTQRRQSARIGRLARIQSALQGGQRDGARRIALSREKPLTTYPESTTTMRPAAAGYPKKFLGKPPAPSIIGEAA